jgi:ornithine cyclodeaminase/alanine dehydrogenase-like protein (mu-crystallin family)
MRSTLLDEGLPDAGPTSTRPALFLTARDCRDLLSPDDVLAEIERALRWDAAGTIHWPTPRSLNIAPDRWGNDYHVKACVLEEVPVGGIRLVSHPRDESSPINTRLIVLIDPATTLPLAIVDESWTYQQRTVASVVLASRRLATPEARTLAVVGAGKLARAALTYYAHLFPLEQVRIASRRPETRAALAEQAARRYGVAAEPAPSVEAAVRGADLVLTCTSSGQPLLEVAWIRPGAVVASLETSEPGRDFAEQADLFVVDSREQLHKELVATFGPDAPGWVDATVGEVVTGSHPGRTDPSQRVLIVTEGMASQDIGLAYRAYCQAVARGVGVPLPSGRVDD